MIKPAVRTTLYEEISRQIIEIVKEGKWIPGDKIPGEIELSQLFQVSRNCIREALKALELAGIVESKPGRGTFLTTDALRNINRMELLWLLKNNKSSAELMETRLVIEPHLAYYAAKRASEDDITKLQAALDNAFDAVMAGKYTIEMGYQFHMTIAEISGNSILSKFENSITDELKAQRYMDINKYLDNKRLIEEHIEHKEILEVIKAHQPDKAYDIMYKHIYVNHKDMFDEGEK